MGGKRKPSHTIVHLQDHSVMLVQTRTSVVRVKLSHECTADVRWCRWTIMAGRYVKADVVGTNRTILLHRFVTAAPDDLEIDHINGDTFDNRLENLRAVTRRGNARNRGVCRDSLSGHKGVHWHRGAQKWMARGRNDDGTEAYLGIFDDLDEASRVADAWRALHYPTSPEARR